MLLTLSEILLTASEILPTPSATNFIEYKGRKYKDGKQGRSVIFLVYLSEIFLSPNRGKENMACIYKENKNNKHERRYENDIEEVDAGCSG